MMKPPHSFSGGGEKNSHESNHKNKLREWPNKKILDLLGKLIWEKTAEGPLWCFNGKW